MVYNCFNEFSFLYTLVDLPQEQLFQLIGKVSFIHFMKILSLEITEILLTLHGTFVLPAFCWQASEKTYLSNAL